MAYIGKQPLVGNYISCDSLSASATTTYNLTSSGTAVYPTVPQNCIVSLNGVVQAPVTSFTISGATIVFSTTLSTTDSIDYITVLGSTLNIGTPSNNTVGLSQLSATGTPSSTTFLRGDNSWAGVGGTPTLVNYDTGTAATWTKPSSANWVQINIWGGGGSGGKGATDAPAGGGGGGAYNTLIIPFSYLVGAVTYTVGAGGASQTSASTVGNAGGVTSVSIANYNGTGLTKTIYAYGGGAGGFNAAGGRGGGGGGILSAGGNGGTVSKDTQITNTDQTTTGISCGGFPSYYYGIAGVPCVSNPIGSIPIVQPFGGGFGGATFVYSYGGGVATYKASFWNPTYGGGGGGYGVDGAGTTDADAGSSQYGGGGGGGASNSGTAGVGGTSNFGGGGSNGTIDANNSSAGTVPAGGSGGTEGGNSGAGASGRVQFIYW